jgi:hypothetical protein
MVSVQQCLALPCLRAVVAQADAQDALLATSCWLLQDTLPPQCSHRTQLRIAHHG